MYFTVILILDDLGQETDLLDAWEAAGVSGVTVFDSTGLGRIRKRASLRDDMPLMPSLQSLLQSRGEDHRTFMTVVAGEEMVERIIQVTEGILGDMAQPNTGILFAMPVARVVGVPRHGQSR